MAQFVLVADAGAARIFRIVGRMPNIRVAEMDRLERPSRHIAARDMTSDLTGRVFSYAARGKGGKGRPLATPHGAQSDFDPHAAEVARFTKQVARKLEALRREGELTGLVLIAEPRFLGLLRRQLRKPLQALVRAEIARDFIHAKAAGIEKSLRAHAAA